MRITLLNNFRVIWFHILGTILMILCFWVFVFEHDLVLIFSCFWLIYTIPALYLHIEYIVRDSGKEIEISDDALIIKQRGCIRKYNSNELAKIIVYKSASLDKGGIQFSAIESYFYSRIITKGNEEIIITCLISHKIDKELAKLSQVHFERIKKFFCTTLTGL